MEILSLAVVGLMAGATALWRVPANRCDQCAHCLAERREEARQRQEAHHRQVHGMYATGDCPHCHSDD
jgi:hypothetical protein